MCRFSGNGTENGTLGNFSLAKGRSIVLLAKASDGLRCGILPRLHYAIHASERVDTRREARQLA